jgi:hypothetical protein
MFVPSTANLGDYNNCKNGFGKWGLVVLRGERVGIMGSSMLRHEWQQNGQAKHHREGVYNWTFDNFKRLA